MKKNWGLVALLPKISYVYVTTMACATCGEFDKIIKSKLCRSLIAHDCFSGSKLFTALCGASAVIIHGVRSIVKRRI